MELIAGISSLVEEAKGQLDEIIQILTEDDMPQSLESLEGFSDVNIGAKGKTGTKNLRTNSKAPKAQVFTTKHDTNYLSKGRQFGQGKLHKELDASVPHETFIFVSQLLKNERKARNVFISYYTLSLESGKKSLSSFNMSRLQVIHAQSILRALPALDRLRFKLCPSVFSDKTFWCIYFSLVKDKGQSPVTKLSLLGSKDCITDSVEKRERSMPDTEFEEDKLSQASLDSFTGMKREREKETDRKNRTNDIGIVPGFILSGASKTLRFAEQLIESVDEKASARLNLGVPHLATNMKATLQVSGDGDEGFNPSPCTPTTKSAKQTTIEPASFDSKRARCFNSQNPKKFDWKKKAVAEVGLEALDGWSYVTVKGSTNDGVHVTDSELYDYRDEYDACESLSSGTRSVRSDSGFQIISSR
mmetsp:Transcript_15333/g.17356  ORF Transcript_15333/g.17356 Transcript_15333/m.17356 type:complete len:417 (+) Transcript_15333:219-1469(+)